MYCPKCGTQNESEYRFCMKCGTPLPESSSPPSSVESVVVPGQQQQDDFEQVATNDWSQPIYSPGAVPTPYKDIKQNQVPLEQESYVRPVSPPGQPQQFSGVSGQGAKFYPTIPPVNISAIHIWGPFAGYGTRRRHVGWLLDNRGDQSEALNQKINQKFSERSIPGTAVSQESLKGRGILIENRNYFLLR